MRLLRILLFTGILFVVSSWMQQPGEKPARYRLEGTLTEVSQYCGGAQLPDAEYQKHVEPRPYGTKLYLRKGKVNSEKSPVIDSAQTDSKGYFRFNVLPGDYVIILPEQRKQRVIRSYMKMANSDLSVDSICLKNWWKGGLFKVSVVDSNIDSLDYCFMNRCFEPLPIPCFDYHGPYPP